MLTDIERFRPSRIWKQMPQARRLEAAEAFWQDEHSEEQHPEAVVAIAQHLRFRPKSVAMLPLARKTRYLAGLPSVSDTLAGRLLVAYHLAARRPMMGHFLDALQIPHEDGLITAEELKAPPADALVAAAAGLAAQFPREDVELYFATLVSQDPDTWRALQVVLAGMSG